MTDKSPDAYQDAIHKLMDYLNDTVVFAKEQMPDVAKEMLTYGASIDWLWIWICLGLLVVGICVFFCGVVYDGVARMFFGGATVILCILSIGCITADLMKISQAPKLYIMDELSSRLQHKSTK